jgi:hypothetical protein
MKMRTAWLALFAAGMIPCCLGSSVQAVLELRPSGYWPADEGTGEVLNDRSGGGNNGTLFHVPWKNGLLDFTSAYQWAEIAGRENYQGEAFSIGGWLFSRRDDYVSGGRQSGGMYFFGNTSGPKAVSVPDSLGAGLSLGDIGGGLKISVRSGGKDDVLGSMSGRISLESGKWQHLIYTFDKGTGKLYLDGQLVKESAGVPFNLEVQKRAFFVGADTTWWMVHPPPARSLDGSVKELVVFSRALSAEEISRLCEVTRPQTAPQTYPAGSVRLDAQTIPLRELPSCSVEERLRVLELLEKRKPTEISRNSDVLFPILGKALQDWPTRRVAASLLVKLDSAQSGAVLQAALPELIGTVRNEQASSAERAASALALAEMKGSAKEAAPVLTKVLEGVLAREGVRTPRVEDLLRNALIRALLNIDPTSAVLGQALPKGDGGSYFSQGDVYRDGRNRTQNERAYTSVAERDGVTYKLHAGVSFDGAEPVSAEEFAKAVKELSTDYPSASIWRKPNAPNLYRVKITRTAADGGVQTAFLEGENFIFDGTDLKMRGWSVAVDKEGYLHLAGGQHNGPNPEYYIPGSWEKMGLPRDRNDDNFPSQMYWVSEKPGDMTSFKFAGQKNNPRRIQSPDYLNYINFVQDQNGELYVYGRISVAGWQSWGLYHYETAAKQWLPLGGEACTVTDAVKKNQSGWLTLLIRNIRGKIPEGSTAPSMVWAWQPHFYNYCRSTWGVKFDRTNRMHVQMPIRGLDAKGQVIDRDLYAWSDDGGKTFHRADGSGVKLPLTVNPAPEHNAALGSPEQLGWDVWLSVLKQAGYQN